MNLPNAITVARLFMVPLFMYLAYRDTEASALAALVVFVIASLSDSLDGYIARSRGLVTKLGQFLDPLADKVLVLAALVLLVDQRGFPLWAAALFLVREAMVQLLRNRIVSAGGTLPASVAAKGKTALQVTMISWWLLPWSQITVGHWILLAVALLAAVYSGIEYFVRYLRKREESTA